jgi:hypothetical protein
MRKLLTFLIALAAIVVGTAASSFAQVGGLTFTSSGTLACPSSFSAQVLVVAVEYATGNGSNGNPSIFSTITATGGGGGGGVRQ